MAGLGRSFPFPAAADVLGKLLVSLGMYRIICEIIKMFVHIYFCNSSHCLLLISTTWSSRVAHVSRTVASRRICLDCVSFVEWWKLLSKLLALPHMPDGDLMHRKRQNGNFKRKPTIKDFRSRGVWCGTLNSTLHHS